MSLIPRVYNSTDPGAPQLTGMVGSLTAVLDAVLVDGYGVGADMKAPAGWTREFSATNVRVYRGNASFGSGYFLRIDDSAAIGNARHAWACGYESMSTVDAGINPVPLKADRANGVLVPKSLTTDSVVRRWRVVATELFVYVFIDTSSRGIFFPWFAGDANSYKPGDLHCFVVGDTTATSFVGGNTFPNGLFRSVNGYSGSAVESNNSLFVARSQTGAVGAIRGTHFSLVTGLVFGGYNGGGYPSAVNGGLLHGPMGFITSAYVPRGELPGAIGALQSLPLADGIALEGVAGFEDELLLPIQFGLNLATNPTDANYRGCVLLRLNTEWHR